MATRGEVYHALNKEREYQEDNWVDAYKARELNTFIVKMETFLDGIKSLITIGDNEYHRTMALNELRKVVALGVAAMEMCGVVNRESLRPSKGSKESER